MFHPNMQKIVNLGQSVNEQGQIEIQSPDGQVYNHESYNYKQSQQKIVEIKPDTSKGYKIL